LMGNYLQEREREADLSKSMIKFFSNTFSSIIG
jgi:hypothetical protein